MSGKTAERLSVRELEKLEKYIKAFIAKVPQAIVQSRCGQKKKRSASNSSLDNDIYEIAIEDNQDIHSKVREASANINPLQEFSLNIEILLKTAEGDTLVLETWNLKQVFSETFWDARYKVYAESEIIISNLMMLLKSVIAVTRIIPAFKLSLGQSALTYVILYRVYPGEPQVVHLGINPLKNKIGEVYTPIGTISITVAYRSKLEMTIAPKNSEKENSFMVKSDYFNLDMSPKRTSSAPRIIKNRILRNSSNSQNMGAFAQQNSSPDAVFPELAFLQRSILHPSRSCLRKENEKPVENENIKGDLNSNVRISPEHNKQEKKGLMKECEKLSISGISDESDFVLVDLKPPFAACDPDHDIGTFFKECQLAPPLSSFSEPPSLEEQVLDVASQLEKFEISMMDFDNFVDSVCQVNSKN